VNQRGFFGLSALMLAAEHTTNPEVIEVLLAAGADRNARSSGGMRAAEFAVTNTFVTGGPAAAALAAP
jgi:ankyrin repeat protein